MLGYLNDNEVAVYQGIVLARALGRPLNTTEKFAARLLDHFNGDWKKSQEAEEELIADIDASDIDENQKITWLRLFQLPEAAVKEELAQWSWVKFMRYVDAANPRNTIGLALAGVTEEKYDVYMRLRAKFEILASVIVEAGCTQRLIMTDDVINFTVLRERAMTELKSHKELFYFGVTLPQEAQDMIDDIVRNDKALFIEMVESGAAACLFPNIQRDSNNPGGTWLVTMQCTDDCDETFGFFISKEPTRPRRDWSPKLQAPKQAARVDEFIGENLEVRREAKAEFFPERRNPANANIPAIPERRVKTPMALSNRPMAAVIEKPKPKKIKTAPKPRAKKFEVIHSVKS